MAKSELVKKLANEISKSMREYRDAQKRDPEYGEIKAYNLLEGLDQTINDMNHHGGIYSEHNLSLTATLYWRDIIIANINILGMTGGFELMQEVCAALEELSDNDVYDYQGIFDSCADGLHGWYK